MPVLSHIETPQPPTPFRSQAVAEEAARLQALYDLDLLDTAPEAEFDELVKLASEICNTPISLITLVDHSRQWFKAAIGTELTETKRDYAFCAHAIGQTELFVVEDAALDSRFKDNPLVTEGVKIGPRTGPKIRFYAGMPLYSEGAALGTLCVIDSVPRSLTQAQQEALTILAHQVQTRIQLRTQAKTLTRALRENELLSASLQSSNSTFRAFMDNGPFASFIKDAEGRMVFYNQMLADRYSVSREAWIGLTDYDLWPKAMADEYREHDLGVLEGRAPIESIETSPSPEGGVTKWRSYKFPIQQDSGEWMIAGIAIDITDSILREAELERALATRDELLRELEGSRMLFRTFHDHSPNHCFLKNEEGRYLFYNQSFAQHFGIDEEAWIGRTAHEVLPKDVADGMLAHDQQVLRSDCKVEICDRHHRANGSSAIFRSIKFPITGTRGERLIGGVTFDVTEEVKWQGALSDANEALELLASIDALTGLYNRRIFDERIKSHYAIAERKARPLALLVMDIDDFKKRNDVFGHAAGDDVLRGMGRFLADTVRAGDLAARIGGEEFAILLPESSAAQAMALAERIQSRLTLVSFEGGPVTVSIGIAVRDSTTQIWERLLAYADDAMYEAKRSGKNRIATHPESAENLANPPVGNGENRTAWPRV